MYESVLVPIDGSQSAEAALAVAARVPTNLLRLVMVQPDSASLDTVCRSARDGRAYLEGLAAPLRRLGRTIETCVLFGDPGRQIVAVSAVADLVVMGSRGCGATHALVLGSVASWVATHSPVPAMIVRGGDRPAAASALDRVVVALDGSPLAESALPAAEKLATELGLPIHLVRVMDFDPIRAVVQTGTDAASAWSNSLEETIQQAQEYLASRARRLQDGGYIASYELRQGLPVTELLDVLRSGDVVVVTTRQRGEFRRWLLGSVTDELIRHAPCPVLLARPMAGDPTLNRRMPTSTTLSTAREAATLSGSKR